MRLQAEEAFADPYWREALGHTLAVRAADNTPDPSRGLAGYVTTYQGVAAAPDLHLAESRRHRTLLVVDEMHHLPVPGEASEGDARGDDPDDPASGWSAALLPLLECARVRLLLSGTLERSDGRRILWLPYRRSERASHLSALMTYRVAAGVLAHLLPVAAGTSPETFRNHTLKLGEELRDAAVTAPAAAAPAPAIAISLDSTFIRSCHDGERYLEVRVGNAETPEGGRQVFGAVANAGTDIVALIRRTLEVMGRSSDTALTAFTDGCSSVRSILADAGVANLPILD